MLDFFKGDKAALQKMMDQIGKLTASEYIESTWNALQAVLPSVNGVLGNENAIQEEVDEVYSELVRAFVNLRLKPNKDLLQDLYIYLILIHWFDLLVFVIILYFL